MKMQQTATNKFIEQTNEFGTNYEKNIAAAFEEISNNVAEINNSINALYAGPESFVKKAEEDLSDIECEFTNATSNAINQLEQFKRRLFHTATIILVAALFAMVVLTLACFYGTGFINYFMEQAAQDKGVVTFICWILTALAAGIGGAVFLWTKKKRW